MRYGWTFDRMAWESFSELASEALRSEWGRVGLDPLNRDSVPMRPGIYLICAEPSATFSGLPRFICDAVYVGKADLLRNRFLNHCRNPAPRLKMAGACFTGRLKFCYVEADSGEVEALESRLIECLGPPANQIRGVIRAVVRPSRPA